jgi:type IV secretion system pilin
MKARLAKLITSTLIAIFGVVGVMGLQTVPAYAVDCKATPKAPTCAIKDGTKAAGGNTDTSCGTDGKTLCTLGDRITQIIDVLLFLIGAVAVIMVILGGIRYVLSNGDSTQITGAKNTILYAVIGLVVALLAYAIVHFVITQFT